MALAWAVVEDLARRAGGELRTLFATHYHELTALEGRVPGVFTMNIAIREYNNDILFLHKLVPGPSDRSYGVEVARLAGVPEGVIRRAREILTELEGGQGVHPQPAQTPEEDQFSLAELGSRAVLDRLEQTDVNALSPIQALNLLDELKRMLEG